MKLIEQHLKEEFENYLRVKTNLSEKSVKNYSQGVYGSIDNWTSENNEISDINDVDYEIDTIKGLSDFRKFNAQGNGMYNSGLNYLGKFLKFKLTEDQKLETVEITSKSNSEVTKKEHAEHNQQKSSDPNSTQISIEEVYDEIENAETLDKESKVIGRKEQKKLRELHIDIKSYGTCSICGSKLPSNLLIAAHIKKRSKCNLEEKKDLYNIATPMCALGCDALFERGYISINEGKVVAVVPPSTNNAQSHIDMLIGEVCRDFKDSNRRYFDWHFEYHSKRLEKE
jgi:hypothetical protein